MWHGRGKYCGLWPPCLPPLSRPKGFQFIRIHKFGKFHLNFLFKNTIHVLFVFVVVANFILFSFLTSLLELFPKFQFIILNFAIISFNLTKGICFKLVVVVVVGQSNFKLDLIIKFHEYPWFTPSTFKVKGIRKFLFYLSLKLLFISKS